MQFIVSYFIDDAEQFAGIKPHDSTKDKMLVGAKDRYEAIDECIEQLRCAVTDNGYRAELKDDEIELVVYDEYDNVVESYYNFTAERYKH